MRERAEEGQVVTHKETGKKYIVQNGKAKRLTWGRVAKNIPKAAMGDLEEVYRAAKAGGSKLNFDDVKKFLLYDTGQGDLPTLATQAARDAYTVAKGFAKDWGLDHAAKGDFHRWNEQVKQYGYEDPLWAATDVLAIKGASGAVKGALKKTARKAANRVYKKEGIKLSAGQKLNDKKLLIKESETATRYPESYIAQLPEKQAKQFTKAAMKRVGSNLDNLGPDVGNTIAGLQNEIAAPLREVARGANIPTKTSRAAAKSALTSFKNVTQQTLSPEHIMSRAEAYIRGSRTMPGKAYAYLRSELNRAAAGMQYDAAKPLYDMIHALDDAVTRHSPDMSARVGKARATYRNTYPIKDAMAKGGGSELGAAGGYLTPNNLFGSAQKTFGRGKANPFDELARAGKTIPSFPNSGTVARAWDSYGRPAAAGMLVGGLGGASGGGGWQGGGVGAGLGAAAALAAPWARRFTVGSRAGQAVQSLDPWGHFSRTAPWVGATLQRSEDTQ
jgi:hypothetical protein